MIRQLCDKLLAILRGAAAKNGKVKALPPVEALIAGYNGLQRLSEQIRAHAERAPYPHIAARLRQIASEKERLASGLREKILGMGGALKDSSQVLKTGKNHWERMVQDLTDQKDLEAFLLQQATFLYDEAPEAADLLSRIATEQAPHREILLDLIARADPQAEQS